MSDPTPAPTPRPSPPDPWTVDPTVAAAPPGGRNASPHDAGPPPRRRRSWARRLTQVSLGGLLTLVVVCAAGLAGRNWLIQPYVVQAEAEDALLELGARLESEPGTPAFLAWFVGPDRFHRVTAANLEHSRTTDKDLVHLHRLPWLTRLYLARSRVTDAGLVRVGYCQGLTRMSLWGNPGITDAGMASLTGLTTLEALDIGYTSVTDAGVADVARLPRLVFLKLPGGVGGAGLAHLAGHPALVDLNLHRAGVRDRDAVHLLEIPHLRKVTVSTLMTDASLAILGRCPSLLSLDLATNGRITAYGLMALRPNQLVRLESTDWCRNQSPADLYAAAIARQGRLPASDRQEAADGPSPLAPSLTREIPYDDRPTFAFYLTSEVPEPRVGRGRAARRGGRSARPPGDGSGRGAAGAGVLRHPRVGLPEAPGRADDRERHAGRLVVGEVAFAATSALGRPPKRAPEDLARLTAVVVDGPDAMPKSVDLTARAPLEQLKVVSRWHEAATLSRLHLTPSCRTLSVSGVIRAPVDGSSEESP